MILNLLDMDQKFDSIYKYSFVYESFLLVFVYKKKKILSHDEIIFCLYEKLFCIVNTDYDFLKIHRRRWLRQSAYTSANLPEWNRLFTKRPCLSRKILLLVSINTISLKSAFSYGSCY